MSETCKHCGADDALAERDECIRQLRHENERLTQALDYARLFVRWGETRDKIYAAMMGATQ